MKISKKKFDRSLASSQASIAIKSTRRVFFNHLDETVEVRGHFHADRMFGSGTSILVKLGGDFHLLTANHVIANATSYKFGNESPFWVSKFSDEQPTSLQDFLFPAWIHHIGELISDSGKNIDAGDVVLITLFPPLGGRWPDRFMDLDTKRRIMRKEEYFDGQLLLAAGYPFEKNYFTDLEVPVHDITHTTLVQRHIVSGVCKFDDREPYLIGPEELIGSQFPNLDGASGGIATNVQPKSNEVRMAGMLVSAGPRIVRFIPGHLIQGAIERRWLSRITVVDPAAQSTLNWRRRLQAEFRSLD